MRFNRSYLRSLGTTLTAGTVAVAMAVSSTAPPAAAAPQVTVRTSAHGQYLCTISIDKSVAQHLADAYRDTITAAAADVVAKEKVDPRADAHKSAVELALHNYTEDDIVAIQRASTGQEVLKTDLLDKLLPNLPEASLNRALTLAQEWPSGSPAPLLSEGTGFSPQFRQILASHEANLRPARDAYEAEAGHAAVRAAYQNCAEELRRRGVTAGFQPLPEILVPVDAIPLHPAKSGSAEPDEKTITGITILSVLGLMGIIYVLKLGIPGLPKINLPF